MGAVYTRFASISDVNVLMTNHVTHLFSSSFNASCKRTLKGHQEENDKDRNLTLSQGNQRIAMSLHIPEKENYLKAVNILQMTLLLFKYLLTDLHCYFV